MRGKGSFRKSGRGTVHRQSLRVPLRVAQRIAVNILVTELYGHTGRRVAADSCQARSVKHDETILVRSQEFFKGAFIAPA